jgi:hypothetical protein
MNKMKSKKRKILRNKKMKVNWKIIKDKGIQRNTTKNKSKKKKKQKIKLFYMRQTLMLMLKHRLESK